MSLLKADSRGTASPIEKGHSVATDWLKAMKNAIVATKKSAWTREYTEAISQSALSVRFVNILFLKHVFRMLTGAALQGMKQMTQQDANSSQVFPAGLY